MFFKVVTDFLPQQIFNRLLKIVESKELAWRWASSSFYHDRIDRKGDNNFMLGTVIFSHPRTPGGYYEETKYAQLFYLIADYQNCIRKSTELIKMKLNLYSNQGENVKHARHADMMTGKKVDDRIMTSILNFHTCNGSTVIELGDGKTEEVKSKANQLIMFDNTWHHGITQSDTPRRIVLNINVLK